MNEYYGAPTTSTSDYLAHYGVKGMRWGVRKAIQNRDSYALSKHFAKAQNKLRKLSETANTGKGIVKKRVAGGALASAIMSGAATYGLNRIRGVDPVRSGLTAAGAAGLGGVAGGLLSAGRVTPQERAAAKANKEAWKREMNQAFKGTKYGKSLKSKRNRQASLKRKALDASNNVDEARANLSFAGKHGFGKTANAYRNAVANERNATSAYYNSLSKKQYARLRRNHVG